jgi:hypothetical protein
VRGTLKRLKLARSKPLGIVLNKFATPVGYGYGYGYDYSYGAEREADHNEELEQKPDDPRELSSGAGAA